MTKTLKNIQKTCCSCKFCKHSGIQEVSLDTGSCKKYKESGRNMVFGSAYACDFYKERSYTTTLLSQKRAKALMSLVEDVNRSAHSNRRAR